MTQPPPPGPWNGQPAPGQWPQGPGAPGGYGPPPQWPTPVPPKKGGPLKWILGAVALIAVIAVTAVVAVSCTKSGGNGGGSTTAAPNNSGIASANDTGPVGIITEDPSCAPWKPIATTLTNAASNGWDKRDPSVSSSDWTPEQRTEYEAVAQAYLSAADQTVALAKLTTHRALRELYSQFISYARAYAKSVPTYAPADDKINLVATSIMAVINSICDSIGFGVAAARSPLVSAAAPPTHAGSVTDASNPDRFMPSRDPQCADWINAAQQLKNDPAFGAWSKEDSSIPASSWSDQYKAENQAVIPALNRAADTYEKLGRQNTNPFIEDLGVLSAQYLRAFIAAIPTYSQPDSQLYNVFGKTAPIISAACDAAGVS